MQSDNVYARSNNSDEELSSLIGRSLGQFRIVDRIGAGGMATVFKAYQPTLDRYVAVKVLPSYHARDQNFLKRFEQEARAVARLAHPNIVQIHDFGEQDQINYIVMEYVDGGTLKDRLKRALPVVETVDVIIQAAEGLDCAHRHNIIHRDVKPANMLMRKDGHLLLSDFGIAKILESANNLTRAGTGIGTPQYMSPEQGTGQPVDRRSDIYSLGIVFFHCLTGRVPFNADSPLTITLKHLHDPLPMDKLAAEQVPPPIMQIVAQMTAKRPEERYQTTEALIEALSSAMAQSDLSVPRPWRAGMSFGPVQSKGPASMPLNAPPSRGTGPQPNLQQYQQGQQPYQGQQQYPQQGQQPYQGQQQQGYQNAPMQSAQPAVNLICFRCNATNPSSRLYCTTCGYDLSNEGAKADRYMTSDGRPVLARLTIQNGTMVGRSYRFHQVVTTIGRTNGNDLVISGRTVSRKHARLWFANGSWYLEDLQSANGTLVNNMRIVQQVQLNDNDVINFGDEVVSFNITYGP